MKGRARRLLCGLGLLGAFAGLGAAVSSHPPGAFDLAGAAVYGQATPLAIVATKSGLFAVYVPLCTALLIWGLVQRAWLPRAVFLTLLVLVSWFTSDFFKGVFARPRPDQWLFVHETSASYPSGHAVLSLATYGLLAAFVWTSAAPRGLRVAGAALLALWVACIDWSRLALGAHYPSDVLGGVLLELGLYALASAAYDPLVRAPDSRRTFVAPGAQVPEAAVANPGV